MTPTPPARPITPEERPYLMAAGTRLRAVRQAVGLSQADVGYCCGVNRSLVAKIELGQTRTRASMLRRLANELHEAAPDVVVDLDALVAELVTLAGPTLVPESPRQERIDRRRDRRAKRFLKHTAAGFSLDEAWWRSASRGWREF